MPRRPARRPRPLAPPAESPAPSIGDSPALRAPSQFSTLDFVQHFAAPRFEHPEGSISGSPIIDDDVTAHLLDASAAAAAAYRQQRRLTSGADASHASHAAAVEGEAAAAAPSETAAAEGASSSSSSSFEASFEASPPRRWA